jgi:hypothetical protein
VPENYFGERIAETYEAKWPELFEPAAMDPVVATGPASASVTDLAATSRAACRFPIRVRTDR